MKKIKLKKIRSYKSLVDSIFLIMIRLLNNCYDIEIVKDLKYPDSPNMIIDGYVDEENDIIKINKFAENQINVLIHELIHIIFDDVLEMVFEENEKETFNKSDNHENFILHLEKIFCNLLSPKQKGILKLYLENKK